MKANLKNLTIVGVATVIVASNAQSASLPYNTHVAKSVAKTPIPKPANGFWGAVAGSASKSLVTVLPASIVARTQPVTLPPAILPPNNFKPNAVTVVTPPSARPAVSVPDCGTTVAMLGTTLAGIALLKKKNAFRLRSLPTSAN